jgi:hypothetical protein
LTLASAACASAGHRSGQPAASLIFRNESPTTATVYVVAPGVERRRIGTVIPGQTETLTVPAHLAARGASLNISRDSLAQGERPQTGPILIHPGDRYEVRLTSDLIFLSFLPAGS